MSGKKNQMIYRRPKTGYEELDPENWEDLTLCNAYDKAVNDGTNKTEHRNRVPVFESNNVPLIKGLRSPQEMGDHIEQNTVWTRSSLPSSINTKIRNEKFKSSPKCTPRSSEISWKAGDACVALYYDDSLYYDCTITSIDKSAGSCVIEYTGYGNKETIDVTDLHSPDKWEEERSSRLPQECEASNKSTGCSSFSSQGSLSSTDDTSPDVTQDLYKGHISKKKKREERKGYFKKPVNNHIPPPIPNFSSFAIPPPPPCMGQDFPFQPTYSNNANDLSDDALSSLLMSWYMAGYHTGYYQGINTKGSRKNKRK